MTAHDVLINYEGKLQDLRATAEHVRVQHLATATALMVAVALLMALGFYAVRQRIPHWWPSLPIPIVAASARRYRRLGLAGSQMRRLQGFYRKAILRVKGIWPGQGFTGDEFSDADHVYAKDLSLFGEGFGEARFEAIALGHPLLPAETCVRNDVRLNRETRFYVVSGSNMSGKSSLLRAIGLNAVLAFAGAPGTGTSPSAVAIVGLCLVIGG